MVLWCLEALFSFASEKLLCIQHQHSMPNTCNIKHDILKSCRSNSNNKHCTNLFAAHRREGTAVLPMREGGARLVMYAPPGDTVFMLLAEGGGVRAIDFSSDGHLLVSGGMIARPSASVANHLEHLRWVLDLLWAAGPPTLALACWWLFLRIP